MTNTFMLAGTDDPAEILRSVARGIYAVSFSGGQVDITSGKFVFSANEAYRIEDGRIGAPLKGATLIGNGPDVLTRVPADRKRSRARSRRRDLRQGRPERPGRRRHAYPAHRRPHRRGHAGMSPAPARQPRGVVEQALAAATRAGADAADAVLLLSDTIEARVRGGEIDFVKQARERTLGIRALVRGAHGARSAVTSTSDLAQDAVDRMARETVALARATAEDPAAGLPEDEMAGSRATWPCSTRRIAK